MIFDSPWLEQEQPGAGAEQKTGPWDGARQDAAAELGPQQGDHGGWGRVHGLWVHGGSHAP